MIGSVVIAGASLAGMHAAHTLRRDGYDGRITVVDADANTPYDKPPLSKQLLSGAWEPDRIALLHDEEFEADRHLGTRATGLDVEGLIEAGDPDRIGTTIHGFAFSMLIGVITANDAAPVIRRTESPWRPPVAAGAAGALPASGAAGGGPPGPGRRRSRRGCGRRSWPGTSPCRRPAGPDRDVRPAPAPRCPPRTRPPVSRWTLWARAG